MKEVNSYLQQAHAKSKSLRPLFVYAKVLLDRSVMKTFREGGRPQKWKHLAPLTAACRSAERSGSAILQRYGTLRQSIGTEILEITDTTLVYGTKQVKASLLYFGGTIKPKTSKYLAIPAPGVTGSPRDYEGTFVPRGKHVIMQVIPGGGAKVLFILKTSVTIPARPFLMLQDEDITAIGELASDFLYSDKPMKGAG